MTEIPLAPVKRLIQNTGDLRVSDSASKQLVLALEDIGTEIASKAKDYAKHAGRKTINADDIILAIDSTL